MTKALENISNFSDAVEAFALFRAEPATLYTKNRAGEYVKVNCGRGIERTDTEECLSLVGGRYNVINPHDFAEQADNILQELGGGVYDNGGILADGRKWYIQATLPDHVTVKGTDKSLKRLTFLGSHDGTTHTMAGGNCTRIVCENTFAMSMAELARWVSIKHTRSAQERIRTVQSTVLAQMEYFKGMEIRANFLSDQKFTEAQMKVAIAQVLGKEDGADLATRTQNVADTILGNFQNHDGVGGTAWDAFNAFTYYTNHQKATRGTKDADMRRFEGLLVGQGAALNDKAMQAIMSQVAA